MCFWAEEMLSSSLIFWHLFVTDISSSFNCRLLWHNNFVELKKDFEKVLKQCKIPFVMNSDLESRIFDVFGQIFTFIIQNLVTLIKPFIIVPKNITFSCKKDCFKMAKSLLLNEFRTFSSELKSYHASTSTLVTASCCIE